MADSAVGITEGSGQNIDTRTEGTNGNHRQVVVIGDPATNAGVAPVDATNGLSVTLTTALPAGTAAIGKLAANSGVDIGDVDVTSCALPTGAATSAKQDTIDASINTLLKPASTLAAVTSITNVVHVDDNTGSLTVDGTVTANAGTNLNTSALALETGGNLAAAATSLGNLDNSVDGNYLNVNMNIAGTDVGAGAAAVPISDGGNTITVDNGGTFAVQAACTLGAETTKVIGTVNVAASQTIAVTQATAGNLNCTEASAADIKTAVQTIDNCISGSEAQVDVVAALPAGTNIIGAVKRDVVNYTPVRKYYTNAGAVTDGVVWSPASGKKWVVTDLVINTSAAATVTLEEDLSAGDSVVMKLDLAANGGVSTNFQTPLQSGEDDADLLVTTSAGNIYITAIGYEID